MIRHLLFGFAAILSISGSAKLPSKALPMPGAMTESAFKSPMKVPTTVIPGEEPKGEARFYSVRATTQIPQSGGVMQAETDVVKKIIFGEDGTVWFSNLNYGLPGDYIMGKIEGNRIVCQFPQNYIHTLSQDSEGGSEELYYEMMALDFDVEIERDEFGNPYPFYKFSVSENQTVEFSYDEETGEIEEVSTLGLGTTIMYDGERIFFGYADLDYVMTWDKRITVPEIPNDLNYSNYLFEFKNDYERDVRHYADVAFDGEHLYVKGLCERLPDLTVCMNKRDDRYYVPYGQYLGYGDGSYVVSYPARYDENHSGFESLEEMAFEVNAAEGTISYTDAEDFLAFNASMNDLFYLDLFNQPVLTRQSQPAFAVPTPPYYMEYYDQYWDWGLGNQLIFFVDPVSTDGELLSTKRMYFELYIDGDPYTLAAEEYRNLLEDMQLVPLDFTEDFDINEFAAGQRYDIHFYVAGMDSVGIRVYYLNEDGTYSGSTISTIYLDSAVDAISGTPGAEEYFDLTGRRVADPAKGIFLKRQGGKVSKIMM